MSAGRPAVVTGVSTGIGRAIARALVADGRPIFGTVRSETDAADFEAELGPLASAIRFDLRDEGAIAAAAAAVAGATGGDGLAALVNNAGTAVPGPLEDLSLNRFREQLEINLVSVLAVTQAFLPMLRGPRPGRIVNISSVSGATAMPFLGAYSAAKFGLEGLSDSLRRELRVHGIKVIVVQPGGVTTPIWEKAAAEDSSRYAGGPYQRPLASFRAAALAAGEGGLSADRVAAVVLRALDARRPRARYVVTPHPVTERAMRILPARLLDWLIARRLGLRR